MYKPIKFKSYLTDTDHKDNFIKQIIIFDINSVFCITNFAKCYLLLVKFNQISQINC